MKHHKEFTRLENVDCRQAEFNNAIANNANFENANLNNNNFCNCNFIGVNMKCIRIEDSNFKNARYDKTTVWKEGFDPEKHGAILRL